MGTFTCSFEGIGAIGVRFGDVIVGSFNFGLYSGSLIESSESSCSIISGSAIGKIYEASGLFILEDS